MIVDYHIHTKASPDAEGSMQQFAKQVKRKGINEIGFSEHVRLRHPRGFPDFFVQLMPTYVESFLKFKQKSELPVKLGVEIDFFSDQVEEIGEFVRKYPFDYVIGSIHVIGDGVIDDPSKVDEYLKRGYLKGL
jgi:histidinol-phosphatase (PHP family)